MSKPIIRRISLCGGPGSGKSTLAAYLFAAMKIICNEQDVDLKIEHVQEQLKSEVWAGRTKFDRWDQWYVVIRQFAQEYTLLKNGVDLIITDSPLTIYPYYAMRNNTPCTVELMCLISTFEKDFPSLNIFVERGDKTYRKHGRNETLDQAKLADAGIRTYLENAGKPFIPISFDSRRLILAETLKACGLDPALAKGYN